MGASRFVRERHMQVRSMVDLLRLRVQDAASSSGYVFLTDGEAAGPSLSFARLDERARAVGGKLQGLGLVGERAILLFPSGLDYLVALFGCLYAGVVGVPTFLPRIEAGRPDRTTHRLRGILADARPAVVL